MEKIRGVFEHPPSSGVWWVQFFDAEGRRHREKAGTRSAAIKLKTKRANEKLEARKLPSPLKFKKGVTFEEVMADALAHKLDHAGRSAVSNLRGIIAALSPEFGSREADGITTAEFVNWLRRRALSQNWADGTFNTYVTQLKVAYKLAMEAGKVTTNPAGPLKRRTVGDGKPRFLSAEERAALDEAISLYPEHREAYLFARNTGLRAGAQFGLRWSQVNLQDGSITLPQERKTKYRVDRVLPLNAVAWKVLKDRKDRAAKSPLVFPEYHRKAYLTKPAQWFPAVIREAVKICPSLADFTWHSLRHDFASQLVMKGADLKTVQDLMGHANLKQTAMYAKLSPEHLRSAVELLS